MLRLSRISRAHLVALTIGAVTLSTSACTGIKLRDHVFLGRPAWEQEFQKATLAAQPTVPSEIAASKVSETVKASMHSICKPTSTPDQSAKLSEIRLSRGHFKEFIEILTDHIHHPAWSLETPKDSSVTRQGLLAAYLSAYFSGRFVDRNGGEYSKPKIGMVITNETITGLAAVALEALIDYEVVANAECFKFPIYFYVNDQNKPVFLTNRNTVPTLAKVIYKLNGGDSQRVERDKYERPWVIVNSTQQGKPAVGVTDKLAVTRYFGGLAGDGAQSLTGLIVRNFGGANLGLPVALGKLSLGDNETLSKLVDTVVETVSRRATEAAVSQLVHSRPMPDRLKWVFIGAGPNPGEAE